MNILDRIYKGKYESDKQYLKELTEKAVRLAYSDLSDADAIRKLGEGWVAEETWAIALFCAIRHIDSVEDAIIASVNHDGDSDSTGCIISEYDPIDTPEKRQWYERYCEMKPVGIGTK